MMQKAPDGGATSGVTGYFVIECKSLFSIVLLRFDNGTREAYHAHAFNAVTLWLRGWVIEHLFTSATGRVYRPGSWKYTKRATIHRVESVGVSWALSFRGPWVDSWDEIRNGVRVHLAHGRKVIT